MLNPKLKPKKNIMTGKNVLECETCKNPYKFSHLTRYGDNLYCGKCFQRMNIIKNGLPMVSIEDKIALSHQYSIAFSLSQEQQFQKKMAQAKFTSPSKYIKKIVLEELNRE